MDIDVKYVGDDMLLQVFDEDVTDSDLIGENTIKLSSLCVGNGIDEWFDIQYKGKYAGKVHLRSEWKPSGQQLQQAPANMAPPQIVYTNGQAAKHHSTKAQQPTYYVVQQPMMQQ